MCLIVNLCTICLVLTCVDGDVVIRVKRIVGGEPAEVPPSAGGTVPSITTQVPSSTTPSVVFEQKEQRSAVVNGVKNEDGTYDFLGIRYAEPPVGRFRFQRAKKLKLKGVINATRFGAPCPQWNRGRVIGHEDCLFLNIFTPEVPSEDGEQSRLYPVLFWIHGGNFKTGSAAQYIPKYLVKKGIIVVTIQYRLGSLGFLSIGRKVLPGNTGLFDIATAIKWVRDYVSYFGGDPGRIVPAGQGSGASCAMMLALNRFTRRWVSGIFAMSGSPISPFSLDESEVRTANEVSKETNVCAASDGDLKFVRCMQKLPLEAILKADSAVENNRMKTGGFLKGLSNLFVPGPSEEGMEDERFLPNFIVQSPLEAIKQGNFPSVPLLTGVTKDETGGGCRGNFLEQIKKSLKSPKFLESDIFAGALQANIGLHVNKTVNQQLKSLFVNNDYLKFFKILISSALSDIGQIIKHTTDAFFNLPAFITSHFWSKKGKVFLYSFEHVPHKSLAHKFLSELPLISPALSQQYKKSGAEHGDDLMYLFDLRSLEGDVLDDSSMVESDQRVRENFCSTVAEFLRSGKPQANGVEWKPFSSVKRNYMIIDSKPRLAEHFRKCEMGLWTGDNSILGSPECSVLKEASEALKKTLGATESALLSTANFLTGRTGLDNIKKPTLGNLTGNGNLLGNLVNRGDDNNGQDRLSGGLLGVKNGSSGNNVLGGLLGGENGNFNSGAHRIEITTIKPSLGLFNLSGITTKRPSGGLLNLGTLTTTKPSGGLLNLGTLTTTKPSGGLLNLGTLTTTKPSGGLLNLGGGGNGFLG